VIPLAFYSKEDLNHLRKPVMDMLLKGLKQQGFQPVFALDVFEKAPEWMPAEIDDARARRVGLDLGSRFIIYGSMSKIGEQISFDVRLVDVDDRRATVPIFVTRMGLENLASAAADLSREVGIRVFKKKRIHRVLIAGNQRIEDEAIKQVIKSESGDVFDQAKLRDDLTAIYKMGYFKDVRIEAEDTPQGQDVVFTVEEKPTVSKVVIKGAGAIDEEDILAAMTTREYGILQRAALKADVERILVLYRDDGYYNAEVTYEVEPIEANRAVVTFKIKENDKLYIRKISFSGNQQFSDGDLKDEIKTSEKGFFFWLTESGILVRQDLEVDVDRLAAFYHNQGFMEAKVGSPVITHDGEGIYIDIPIIEGERFRVGKVEVAGEGVDPDERLLSRLGLGKKEYFNREVLAKDLEEVTNFYTGKGYAFAEVVPEVKKAEEPQVVDVTYQVQKGELVDFGRINISGNTKTRDKVIRRELQVVEGSRYSKARLERSVTNLRRLDFFEDVGFDTTKGDSPDQMNLDVKVKEKPTRFVSVGGGFSSADEVFLTAQIAERNLFGRGQSLQFLGNVGTIANRFSLSFTEPWLFDIPLAFTVEAYNWFREYDEYDKDSFGGKISGSYPIWAYTRLYLAYGYDDTEVSDVDLFASEVIKDQEGRTVTSLIGSTVRRDSRDHTFLTTKGSDNSVTMNYAGGVLGGDAGFFKVIANTGWWFPLFWKFVGFLHAKGGYITDVDDGVVPLYEKFYLGGINSLRAFDSGDVSPRDPLTGDKIGGDKMVLFNAELLFPILEDMGVRGVLFFDMGNSYLDEEDITFDNLKKDVCFGIRWYSPMGPIRVEWGYNLDPLPGEDDSNLQFSMGMFW
jgi:outer membrane protein insertion porin family